ncbi:MAG: protein translocase subunit SecF [Gemmatimonadota bacterium]|jgi:preprotein translocase subunit SecF
MKRFFANADYRFIELRRKAYVGSGTLLVLGLVMALFWEFAGGTWLNYGVDFTGGTLVQVKFDTPTSVADLRTLIGTQFPGTEITRFGEENDYLIRAPLEGTGDAASTGDAIAAMLTPQYGADNFTIERKEAVSAKVGSELQERATLAVLLSFIATLIYLAFRFEWRFGLAAVIATVHDILLTLGFISALRLEVGLPMVAAVLTIVGYSLNDTIIIFDRIRENLRKPGRRGEFIAILNRSINETLPRTVLTSGTTLATLFALFLFGGSIIRDFALILIIGIILGTYSSIFVAAPALLEIEQRWPAERKKARVTRAAKATT